MHEIAENINKAFKAFKLSSYEVLPIHNDEDKPNKWGCIKKTAHGSSELIYEHDDLSKVLYFIYDNIDSLHCEDQSMLKTIVHGYAVLAETKEEYPDA